MFDVLDTRPKEWKQGVEQTPGHRFAVALFRTAEGRAPPNVHPWINKNTTSTMEDVYEVMEYFSAKPHPAKIAKEVLMIVLLPLPSLSHHLFPTEELEGISLMNIYSLFVPT